jgi:hypothetical protein
VNDKMFRVLVLGGMALVGCGGSIATKSTTDKGAGDAEPQDASSAGQGFPSETNAGVLDASGLVPDGSTGGGASSGSTSTTTADAYAFPSELPPPPPPPPDAAPAQGGTVEAGTIEAGTADAAGYADAGGGGFNCGNFPCEAPPQQ